MGIPAAQHLLHQYPDHTVIFTVRDAANTDTNTNKLRDAISKHPKAKASILPLDLASLKATHEFADTILSGIKSGTYPPLTAIVCNAYYWNLVGDPEVTEDGYDKTFQVSYLSHAALVLRLLGGFAGGDAGRVILISSDCHWSGKNAMEKYPPVIPEDMDLLVRPTVDEDKQGRGYHRYATAKLALTTWMYALNRHLQKVSECWAVLSQRCYDDLDCGRNPMWMWCPASNRYYVQDPSLNKVTAVAVNPGNMVDSRALRTNTPASLQYMQTFVYKPLLPLLRLAMGPTLRTAAPCGVDVVELTLNPRFAGQRGFFTLLEKDESSPDSQDESIQARLWAQTLPWASITKDNTALLGAF